MKILINTLGTRGDVQPYVAIGRGLVADGHDVTICTCAHFESFITDHGLQYAYMNNDIIDFMHSDEGKLLMENTGNIWQAIKTGLKYLPKLAPMQRRQIDDCWQSTQVVQPDLIIFHPKTAHAKDFAEVLNIPCMLGFYLPMFVPTGEFPAAITPKLNIGRWYNRFTYHFIERATRWGTRKSTDAWRRAQGLTTKRIRRYLQDAHGQPIPALHAYSPSVILQPADWPPTATVTGYWFLDRLDDWCPPSELETFLADGEPPVYIGFGSIFGRNPARLAREVLKAVETTGIRALLAPGWGGLDLAGVNLPRHVFNLGPTPHDWLFPQVSAVVHHGGCGTTAAGLRAGRPTLICPFFGDQPFWGKRVHELGIGPAPIPQKKLTAEKLSHALHQITTDVTMRQRAETLGEQIRGENGVDNAVAFINQWIEHRHA